VTLIAERREPMIGEGPWLRNPTSSQSIAAYLLGFDGLVLMTFLLKEIDRGWPLASEQRPGDHCHKSRDGVLACRVSRNPIEVNSNSMMNDGECNLVFWNIKDGLTAPQENGYNQGDRVPLGASDSIRPSYC
jgi:hypothetical protein